MGGNPQMDDLMGQMESEMGTQPDNTGLGANPFLGSGGGMPQGFPWVTRDGWYGRQRTIKIEFYKK